MDKKLIMNIECKCHCFNSIMFTHSVSGLCEMLPCNLECVLAIVKQLFNGCIFCVDVCNGEVEGEVDVSLIYKIIW